MSHGRIILIAVFTTLLNATTRAHAQAPNSWPLQEKSAGVLSVTIITTENPAIRRSCRVHAVTETEIECGVGMWRKPVRYKRSEVLAIISPPNHSARTSTILLLSGGAACIAASFFITPIAVVIALRSVAGLTPLFALTNLFDDEDHSHEVILYQKPETALAITLR